MAKRRGALERGLTQQAVADAAGLGRNQVRRIEHGQALRVPLYDLARLLSVVGMELSTRAYPAGPPLRDAAHLALLERFRQRLPATARWSVEVPLPGRADQRAWDAVVTLGSTWIGVEAETRLTDVQSVLRRVQLKLRDDERVSRAVLLLADTRQNRRIARECASAIGPDFPVASAVALRALASANDPGGDALAFL